MQTRTHPNPIARDVQNVVSEAQELLKTVKDEGVSRIEDVKSKVALQYDNAREKVGEIQTSISEKVGEIQTSIEDGAKQAVSSTDAYVRANPWTAVGIAAAAGAIIGFLAHRR